MISGFEYFLLKLTNSLNDSSSAFDRYQLLSTVQQVLSDPVAFQLLKEDKIEEMATYMLKHQPKIVVPNHYSLLLRLGFVVKEDSEQVLVGKKDDPSVYKCVDNDPINSGGELVKLAAIVRAAEIDECHYNVDFRVEERRALFNEHCRNMDLNLDYDQFLGAQPNSIDDQDLKLVNIYDDDYELVVPDVPFRCDQLVDEADLKVLMARGLQKFRVKYPARKNLPVSDYKAKYDKPYITFTKPSPNNYFAPGPENDNLVKQVVQFLRENGDALEPEVTCHKYNPQIKSQIKEEYDTPIFEKERLKHVDETELKAIMSTGVFKYYEQIREAFHENKKHKIQQTQEVFDPLKIKMKLTPAMRQGITNMFPRIFGSTFADMVAEGSRIIKTCMYDMHDKTSKTIRGPHPSTIYTDSQFINVYLDSIVGSSSNYPNMLKNKDGVFVFARTPLNKPDQSFANRIRKIIKEIELEGETAGPMTEESLISSSDKRLASLKKCAVSETAQVVEEPPKLIAAPIPLPAKQDEAKSARKNNLLKFDLRIDDDDQQEIAQDRKTTVQSELLAVAPPLTRPALPRSIAGGGARPRTLLDVAMRNRTPSKEDLF